MILYISAKTDVPDMIIDFLEIRLASGKVITVDWDESNITRTATGFFARYKGVYFDEKYANGKINILKGMRIESVCIYSESKEDPDVLIEELQFLDAGRELQLSLHQYIFKGECSNDRYQKLRFQFRIALNFCRSIFKRNDRLN